MLTIFSYIFIFHNLIFASAFDHVVFREYSDNLVELREFIGVSEKNFRVRFTNILEYS